MDRVYNTRKWQVSENETPPAKRGRPKVACVLARYPPITYDGNDEIYSKLPKLRGLEERNGARQTKEGICTLSYEGNIYKLLRSHP